MNLVLRRCFIIEKRRQSSWTNTFWRQRERLKDSMKVASSVARSKDDRPVAKIENQLVSNFSEQILLSNTAWSNYGLAKQFCGSLVDYRQRQPFFRRTL